VAFGGVARALAAAFDPSQREQKRATVCCDDAAALARALELATGWWRPWLAC